MQWFPLLKYLFWGIQCSFIILFVYRFVPNRNIMTLNDITWEFLGGKENLSIIRYHSKIIIGPANIQLWGQYPIFGGRLHILRKNGKILHL